MHRESVSEGELRVESSFDEEHIDLRLSGCADARSMSSLGNAVGRAATEARQGTVREVCVDLRDLEFMNSSCFKHFVTWICAVQDAAPSVPQRFRFRSNPKMLWQRRSLHALAGLAADLVSIES